jgi:4-amino-4-deoxy-L-arabinose transferase-like glycosyltransferase
VSVPKAGLSWLQRWRLRVFPAPPEAAVVTDVLAKSHAPSPVALPYQPTLVAALLGAVALVVLGQLLLARGGERGRPGGVLVAAGLLLVLLAQSVYRRKAAPRWLAAAAARLSLRAEQPILLTLALCCTYAAKALAAHDALPTNPAVPFVLWGVAIALMLFGSRRVDDGKDAVAGALGPAWPRYEQVGVLLLFAAALAIRAWNNGHVPAALTGDEGAAGLMALEWAEGRFLNPFVTGWFSFPSLFFALPASSISLFGRTYAALRAPSALAGALTVLSLYWTARPMFGRATALLGALVLAALNLHVHFSRIGLNNVWDALFMVFALGLFWRGWQSGRRGYFVASGLVVGFSQYFYTSALLLPLVLGGWIGLQHVIEPAAARQRRSDLLLMALAALVVYLPLGLFYLSHSAEFLAPMRRVSLLGSGWFEARHQETGQPYWLILAQNYRDAILGFTSTPLRAWYGGGKPLLLPIFSGLFALGLVLIVSNWRAASHWLLLLWIAGATSIGALTESTPAGQRYVISAPVAALLVGLAIVTLAAWLIEAWPRGRWLISGLALGLVLVGNAQDLSFYFNDYTPNIGMGDNNTQVASTLASHLKDYPPGSLAYFFGPPRMGYLGFSTLSFMAKNVQADDIEAPLTAAPDWPLSPSRTAFVFLPERQSEAAFILERYPGGEAQWYYDYRGEALFWIYEVPGR